MFRRPQHAQQLFPFRFTLIGESLRFSEIGKFPGYYYATTNNANFGRGKSLEREELLSVLWPPEHFWEVTMGGYLGRLPREVTLRGYQPPPQPYSSPVYWYLTVLVSINFPILYMYTYLDMYAQIIRDRRARGLMLMYMICITPVCIYNTLHM